MDARGSREILPAGLTPRLLSRLQAATYCGVSPVSFDTMVRVGTMPKPRRALPTNRKVWDRIELDDAISELPHDGEDGNGVDTWHDYDALQAQTR